MAADGSAELHPNPRIAAMLPTCTFAQTGRSFLRQAAAHCYTCGFQDGSYLCNVCAHVCHAGHDVELHIESEGTRTVTEMYCDCGASGSCAVLASEGGSWPSQFCSATRGDGRLRQAVFACKQCNVGDKAGVCFGCATACHAGHTGLSFANFSDSAVCRCAAAGPSCQLRPASLCQFVNDGEELPCYNSTAFVDYLLAGGAEPSSGGSEAAVLDGVFAAILSPTSEDGDAPAVGEDVCTFVAGGCVLTNPRAYHCYTCAVIEEKSICSPCVRRCHAGHYTVRVRGGEAVDSCCCGANVCCLPCKALADKDNLSRTPSPSAPVVVHGEDPKVVFAPLEIMGYVVEPVSAQAFAKGGPTTCLHNDTTEDERIGEPMESVDGSSPTFPHRLGHALTAPAALDGAHGQPAAGGRAPSPTCPAPLDAPGPCMIEKIEKAPLQPELLARTSDATPPPSGPVIGACVQPQPSKPSAALPSRCIICLDAPSDTVFVPCGHVAACWECALQIHGGKAGGTAAARGRPFCPVCRAGVTAVVRLYPV